MRQSLLALLLLVLPTSLLAAPPRRDTVPADVSMAIHIDLENLQSSAFGKQLFSQAVAMPQVKKMLASVPPSLEFLKQLEVKDVTILTWSEKELQGNTDEPVVLANLKIDAEKLIGLLGHGRDYAQISHHGIAVHHWRPNMEAIRTTLLGPRKPNAKKKDDSQVSYLAFPKPGSLIVTQSLPLMLKTLDRQRGATEAMPKETYQAWVGDRPAWITVAYDQPGGSPSNLIASLRQDSEERVTLNVETTCRSESEKVIGATVLGMLGNADLIGRATAGVIAGFSQEEKPESEGDESEGDNDVASADEDGQNGSFTFGVSLDGKGGPKSANEDMDLFAKEIGKVIVKMVQPSFENDCLKVKASAFAGSWDVNIKSKNNRDDINVHLHLYSTKAKHLASQKRGTKIR